MKIVASKRIKNRCSSPQGLSAVIIYLETAALMKKCSLIPERTDVRQLRNLKTSEKSQKMPVPLENSLVGKGERKCSAA